jgi:two-component system cell cycle sensor histidine kinase/response regulator CckA
LVKNAAGAWEWQFGGHSARPGLEGASAAGSSAPLSVIHRSFPQPHPDLHFGENLSENDHASLRGTANMASTDHRGPSEESAGGVNDMPRLLQKSETMVLALLESASQGIFSVDRRGRIVLVNRRAMEMFGYTREELLGAQIEILLPAGKRAGHSAQRDDYFARPRIRPIGIGMDLAGRRKDGAEFPVEVSLSSIETEEGSFAIAFVSDISQRKLLEEQLLHAQKMEAVGRLAGGVAHDFNNMLTVISGYNRMILDELSPLDPLRGDAEEILKAADRAAALTNQLLAFSRRQIMRPCILNVNDALASTQKMLRRLIGEDIELDLKPAREIGNIRADPAHIEQAIVNLAVNARDAMPTGGRITIESANVRLDRTYTRTHSGVQPGEFVMIAVSDTGHGMDAETRRRIFEPFFTTKERGKGTGLGLATVYGMVKQSGGDIWVYSEIGKGSTFKLYFPKVPDPISESVGGDAELPGAPGSETILLVEDEKAVRELTLKMLEHMGYTVLPAAGGAEAVEVSRSFPGHIALLLTDVVMPLMSGRQLADALVGTRPAMKVLYLSGYTENTVVHHGVLDPGVNFLPKPFSREVLGSKIRQILTD